MVPVSTIFFSDFSAPIQSFASGPAPCHSQHDGQGHGHSHGHGHGHDHGFVKVRNHLEAYFIFSSSFSWISGGAGFD